MRSFLIYTVFGFMATLINMISYEILYANLHIINVISVALSWFLAVTFAFFTNKYIVFREKGKKAKRSFLSELSYFYLCRILSGILDVIIMFIAVDLLDLNHTIWKFVSNLAVGICNFLAGKLFIFKKEDQ